MEPADRRPAPHGRGRLAPAEALRLALLAALLLGVAAIGFRGPHRLYGDSIEYVVQTQSIALDGRIAPDTAARAAYWNRFKLAGIELGEPKPPTRPLVEDNQSGGGFGGLYADNDGAYRYYHFWGYPAFVAPVYLLAHLADPSGRLEHHAFRLVNVALLCLLLAMAYLLWPGWATLAVLALSLLSPLVAYVDWYHPEIFCLFFTFAAFWATERGGPLRHAGPLLLGVAASQNTPLLLFFPLHLLHALATERPRGRHGLARLALRYLPGCLVGLFPLGYFKWHFGVWNLIGALGLASTKYASTGRLADMFFSPMIGALWLMPAFLLLPLPAATRRNAWFVAAAAASVAAAGWLATSTRNFNASQPGAVRYLAWLCAPLLFAALRGASELAPRPRRGPLVAFCAAAALTLAIALFSHLPELSAKSLRRFSEGRRALPEVAALYRVFPWRDDVETLTENILGHELEHTWDFVGVYVWNLGRDRSVWVVSGRSLAKLRSFSWKAAALPAHRVEPPGSVAFEHRDGVVTMRRGAAAPAQHPVLGPYARIWMDAEPGAVETNLPLTIR